MKIICETIDNTGEFKKSPAYRDYEQLVGEIENLRKEYQGVDEYDERFFSNVELLIRYGAFKKIGKGSSRTAYSFDADPRYVLKFAHNDNGLLQNQTELKNAKKGDYLCLVRILDNDEFGILIVEDRCRESTYDDWYRIIGISPHMLSKIVRIVFERKETNPKFSLEDLLEEIRDPVAAIDVLKKTSPMDEEYRVKDHPKIVSCVKNLIAAYRGETKEPKWVALYDLFRFYYDNGMAAMIPEEILFVDQWGVKQGMTSEHDSLIIIDPGVDEDFRPFVGKDGERVR